MKTQTPLLKHQALAVSKLLPIKVGALFMEMGTGKSRTAIEMAVRRQTKIWNVVWFCPVSLKETIKGEIVKHTDACPENVHVFNGKTSMHNVPEADWHVVGIESMSASKRVILAVNALIRSESMVIVDESSYIKGHKSARTDWITRLSAKARYRMILTGTPISQGVVDLFSQMRFLSPLILGYNSFYAFERNHLEYSDRFPGMIVRAHNTKYLAAKIQPYVYQVTKKECLDLPDKLYESRYFSMTSAQRMYYEEAKEEIFALYEDEDDWSGYMIFRLFSALQQIACGFWHRTTKFRTPRHFIEIPHFRIDSLMELVDPSQKTIIWGKYLYDIQSITHALGNRFGQECAVDYHGGYNEKQRHNQIEKFRKDASFFVATPSCAGHGLTLNEADYVVFYNNGFKYSERIQAEDRNHRIGQAKKVLYLDLICEDSIDERIDDALSSKGDVVAEFKYEVDKVKKKKNRKEKIRDLVKSL